MKYFELGYNTMDKGAPLHHGDKITCLNLILINPEGLKVPYDKKCLNVLGWYNKEGKFIVWASIASSWD